MTELVRSGRFFFSLLKLRRLGERLVRRRLRKDATKPSQQVVLLGDEFDKTVEK